MRTYHTAEALQKYGPVLSHLGEEANSDVLFFSPEELKLFFQNRGVKDEDYRVLGQTRTLVSEGEAPEANRIKNAFSAFLDQFPEIQAAPATKNKLLEGFFRIGWEIFYASGARALSIDEQLAIVTAPNARQMNLSSSKMGDVEFTAPAASPHTAAAYVLLHEAGHIRKRHTLKRNHPDGIFHGVQDEHEAELFVRSRWPHYAKLYQLDEEYSDSAWHSAVLLSLLDMGNFTLNGYISSEEPSTWAAKPHAYMVSIHKASGLASNQITPAEGKLGICTFLEYASRACKVLLANPHTAGSFWAKLKYPEEHFSPTEAEAIKSVELPDDMMFNYLSTDASRPSSHLDFLISSPALLHSIIKHAVKNGVLSSYPGAQQYAEVCLDTLDRCTYKGRQFSEFDTIAKMAGDVLGVNDKSILETVGKITEMRAADFLAAYGQPPGPFLTTAPNARPRLGTTEENRPA